MASFPYLTLITFLPAAAALLAAFARDPKGELTKWVALAVSGIVLALSLLVFAAFKADAAGMQFVENHAWIPAYHVRYHLGIDGISLAMVVLTAVLTPLAILASWNSIHDRVKEFFVSILFLETGMMGVFAAADLFLFYVFWEVMLIPMYLIIGVWGGPRRVYAAVKFIVYTIFGSLLMFGAIVYCYILSHRFGEPTFDIARLQQILPYQLGLARTAQAVLFLAFAVSFAIKVPMFPFHTWLPDAHVEAPTAGSVLLAGVLLKMGAYGFIRFAVPFFPDAAIRFTPLIIALSVIGIVYGALMALAQADIKKLIAYSSVSHLGFVMLGLFAGTASAAQGAVLQMVNHGISTGALFLLVGYLYHETHLRGVDDFGGLAKVTPRFAAIFMIVALSSAGLPGTNGFVGEFLVLLGTFQRHAFAAAVGGTGVVLGALYLLRTYRVVFFGPVSVPKHEKVRDIGALEFGYFAPLIVLIFALGVLPNIVLSRTEKPVEAYVRMLKRPGDAGRLIGVRP
ncbi:MAG: NADH-quinone oxidoreductase subunit M [Planctomycetes bacterium]|nr:NADH-quinone oxidoreductase subunit M [Planctomycetota bacterium]